MKIIDVVIQALFLKGCSDYNSECVRKTCRSKAKNIKIFDQCKLPRAKGQTFLNPLKAYQFVQKNGFPVVVKPNVGGFSRGAYFPIKNYYSLFKALILSKFFWPVGRIETYLKGKNYRIVVIKGQIMSVIRRYPPFVIGNGKKTISQLIDQENEIRAKMKLFPVVKPIPKNKKIIQFLKSQNQSLQSIPKGEEKIVLYHKITLNMGGVIEIVDAKNIPNENKILFLNLLKHLNANILGVDLIAQAGIETNLNEQTAIFVEINTRPFLKMHDFPRYGKKENLRSYYQILEKTCKSASTPF